MTALVGRGVTGSVGGGRPVLIGSHRHFDEAITHDLRHCEAATEDVAAGRTPVMVSVANRYIGTLTLADTLRTSSRDAIRQLKALGPQAVVMLTGDQQATARRIGAEVGVTDVRAGLLPEQKLAAVESLKRQYGAIMMVRDGINDTPALATATVGIAIGGAYGGTNQAMETADVTLMSNDLRQPPFAVGLSRAAMPRRTLPAQRPSGLQRRQIALSPLMATARLRPCLRCARSIASIRHKAMKRSRRRSAPPCQPRLSHRAEGHLPPSPTRRTAARLFWDRRME